MLKLASLILCTCGLVVTLACGGNDDGTLQDNINTLPIPEGFALVTRFAHLSDAQVLDEESPARFAPLDSIFAYSWRPQEAYSAQVLDGMVRAINRMHAAGQTIDFMVHTGDATDNNHLIEWRWFLETLDGNTVDPLSGVDDRPADMRPPALLDPHHAFDAAGLYHQGVHGPLDTVEWYAVLGNHDHFAVGNFAIVERSDGRRVAPVPLPPLFNAFLPAALNPQSVTGFAPITPANPGPPRLFNFREPVTPNPERIFLNINEIMTLHQDTTSTPAGHGFDDDAVERSWYAVSPMPKLRLVVLDTSQILDELPAFPYFAGSILNNQQAFLISELHAAERNGQWVIIASHHPSQDLSANVGSQVVSEQLRAVLSNSDRVVLHVAGHTHRHRVIDRGGYLEIETASTLDYPQEGRVIELYESADGTEAIARYDVFSHLPTAAPSDDPLYALRSEAYRRATEDAALDVAINTRMQTDASLRLEDIDDRKRWLHGEPHDRRGRVRLRGRRR